MRTRFLPLLTLRIAHSFYAGPCLDFRYIFPGDTARLLRNGRLLSRERDGVLHLLYEADEEGAAISRIAGTTLRLGLQLLNPFFPNFTRLPAGFPGQKLHYTNAAAAGVLAVGAPLPDPDRPDRELAALDVAGLVEIAVADGFYAAPPALEIAFEARAEALGYYLVARNYSDAELAQLSVSDAGFAEEGRPEIGFQRVEAGAFTPAELAPALVAGNGEKLVLFRSLGPLARRERARRRIQLSKNGEVLIANLPQPGPDRARADLIIHLSKP